MPGAMYASVASGCCSSNCFAYPLAFFMRFKPARCLFCRFHSGGQRQRKKGFSILGICFLALPGKFAGASHGIAKMAHALRIGAAVNPVQEFLFVQEKIAGQYALAG